MKTTLKTYLMKIQHSEISKQNQNVFTIQAWPYHDRAFILSWSWFVCEYENNNISMILTWSTMIYANKKKIFPWSYHFDLWHELVYFVFLFHGQDVKLEPDFFSFFLSDQGSKGSKKVVPFPVCVSQVVAKCMSPWLAAVHSWQGSKNG